MLNLKPYVKARENTADVRRFYFISFTVTGIPNESDEVENEHQDCRSEVCKTSKTGFTKASADFHKGGKATAGV